MGGPKVAEDAQPRDRTAELISRDGLGAYALGGGTRCTQALADEPWKLGQGVLGKRSVAVAGDRGTAVRALEIHWSGDFSAPLTPARLAVLDHVAPG